MSSDPGSSALRLPVYELEPGLVREGADAGRPCIRLGIGRVAPGSSSAAEGSGPVPDDSPTSPGSRSPSSPGSGSPSGSEVDPSWPVEELLEAVLAWPALPVEVTVSGQPPVGLAGFCAALIERGRRIMIESGAPCALTLTDSRADAPRPELPRPAPSVSHVRRLRVGPGAMLEGLATLQRDAGGASRLELIVRIASAQDIARVAESWPADSPVEVILRPAAELSREEMLAGLTAVAERFPAVLDWRLGASRGSALATLDRYELLDELGAGGMGTIYRARHRSLGLEVALKVHRCGPNNSPRQAARLQDEARLLARLDHPGIVRVFDCGEDRGTAFLAMECVSGAKTLGDRMRGSGLSRPELLAIVSQLGDALEHVHSRGILHRDIKSGNVLIRPDGTPVLIDFGLAIDRVDERRLRKRAGTAGYIAPEILAGGAASPRSDLWSLGVLMFLTLVGRRPYRSATPEESLASIQADALDFEGSEVSDDLQALIRSLLALDPADRPESADAVAEALRGLV